MAPENPLLLRRVESPGRAACLDALAAAIVAVKRDHPTRVAIDGVDGSGKTTLADELVAPIRRLGREVIRASVDGFHHPRQVRYSRGAESPEGYFLDSFDYAVLHRQLLEPLGPTGDGIHRTAAFDYRTDRPVEGPHQVASRNAVLLFDGIFLSRRELAGTWDLVIWIEVPFALTVERAIARDAQCGGDDPAAVRARYARRYVPGQQLYIDQCRPRDAADVVFDNSDLVYPCVTCRRTEAPA